MSKEPTEWRADSQKALDAFTECGSIMGACHALGIPRSTLRNRLKQALIRGLEPGGNARKPTPEFEVEALPDPELSAEDLIEQRIRQFEKKKAWEIARKIIPVKIKIDGPIGIWHFGDPHIDDDGTDIKALREHGDIIKHTPGLFGANVGDTTNNWAGRLARLYESQGTSKTQAWILAEWFLRRTPWLYLIGGNHDCWSGAGDPIKWIMRGQSAPYMSSEVRLDLRFPNGNSCRINARHDFSGHSQYNPAHGPMKAGMFGARDHIAVAGHKHISGYGVLKNPDDGSLCHSFLVAGYKVFDRYAMERGFRDQHISPGVFTLIDPRLPNTSPDFVSHFWTLERGVEMLNYLRATRSDAR
jgi:hypothetical protein